MLANDGVPLLLDGVAPHLLGDGANVLRLSLHPDGLAPRVLAFSSFSAHVLGRLRRQAALTGERACQRCTTRVHAAGVEQVVQEYIDDIARKTRPLFDRVHGLILKAHPAAEMTLSYTMPTFVVGTRRFYVGAWSHGLSIYGWEAGRDAGFASRHPELDSGKGTLRLTHAAAGAVTDDELLAFLQAALSS